MTEREGKDPATPPQDTGPPDQVERDAAALSASEDLDEDRLRVDPLERGVEPPERWAGVNKPGTTPFEQSHGESLDQRIAEEQPDVAETAEAAEPAEAPLPEDDDPRERDESAPGRDQQADEAGGSVAVGLRTPPEKE